MKTLLSKEVKSGLETAMGHELYAHSLYTQLSNYSQRKGLFGAQKYFESEAKSELKHYGKLVDYVNDRGDIVDVPAVPKVTDKPETLKEMFEVALEAEIDLANFYTELYEKCEDELEDCVTAQFLLQFIDIQRKSVGEVMDFISTLTIAGDNSAAILLFDQKLAQ